MSRKTCAKEKLKILFYMMVYDLLCVAISLIVLGIDWYFYIGLAVGTSTVMINFIALEKVIECVVARQNVSVAILIHMGRFALFGLAGCFCLVTDITALVAYAIGVIGLTPALVGVYRKGAD